MKRISQRHGTVPGWAKRLGMAVIAVGWGLHAGADFPMAGGGAQRTGYVEARGPAAEPQVLWEAALGVGGEAATQPIIDIGGNIYVTGAPAGGVDQPPETDPRGALVSFDPAGGERWRYEWRWDPNEPGQRGSSSQLSVPALTPHGGIVMGFRGGWLRCWDRDTGDLRWERDLSTDRAPITSAPLVDGDGYVYVYCRDIPVLHKIDGQTGTIEWGHRFADGAVGNASSPSLSLDGQTLYIGRTARDIAYLYAIHVGNGALKWAWSPDVSRGHSFAWSVPVVDRAGRVYMQDEEFAHLYAIDDLGAVHARQWAYKREGVEAPRLAAHDGTALYSSYNAPHPVVFSVDRDGNERWSVTLDEGYGIGGFVVTPSAVYFGLNGTGTVYALSPATGVVLWRKTIGAPGASFSEGLALSRDGRLYTGVDGTPNYPDQAVLVALGTD